MEQQTDNPRVGGSIPPLATKSISMSRTRFPARADGFRLTIGLSNISSFGLHDTVSGQLAFAAASMCPS
jgi:hypothetical protein